MQKGRLRVPFTMLIKQIQTPLRHLPRLALRDAPLYGWGALYLIWFVAPMDAF